MNLRRIKKFVGSAMKDVTSYLAIDLNKYLNDVYVTLGHLTFLSNFDSFSYSLSAAAGETVLIPNRLLTPNLDWIVLRITGANNLIESGDIWTSSSLFLKNASATAITATVCFFRR